MNFISYFVLLSILIEFILSITYFFINMEIALILNTINVIVIYLFYAYLTPLTLTKKGRYRFLLTIIYFGLFIAFFASIFFDGKYTLLWLILGVFTFIQVIFISKENLNHF